MSLHKARGFLYLIARILGDMQALSSPRKGSVKRRIGRRITGKLLGRGMGRIFR
jgi:hypothetical protein